ncbi:hypothetical protein C2S53_008799 [Perilla frutescens var. hirtella]|uniref:Uncharacterized protein n=1 Tax=Perilla frutescens var. hirtella TaxID=608512 RepID=A0AAD4NZB4_PERFH|nr:hypothetical protein C2S53_008799 [Perilla frutescens var. hirtella]
MSLLAILSLIGSLIGELRRFNNPRSHSKSDILFTGMFGSSAFAACFDEREERLKEGFDGWRNRACFNWSSSG